MGKDDVCEQLLTAQAVQDRIARCDMACSVLHDRLTGSSPWVHTDDDYADVRAAVGNVGEWQVERLYWLFSLTAMRLDS
jgi:hypothetical protein